MLHHKLLMKINISELTKSILVKNGQKFYEMLVSEKNSTFRKSLKTL